MAATENSDPPLHYILWGGVVKGGHLQVVQLSLEHGMDVGTMNRNGKTPESSLKMRRSEIAQLLSELRSSGVQI